MQIINALTFSFKFIFNVGIISKIYAGSNNSDILLNQIS